MKIIDSHILARVRDPFVLVADGRYYLYSGSDGNRWVCYTSEGNLTDWTLYEGELVTVPAKCARDNWAPEVHAYRGAYYMFTTYQSAVTGRHGCTILRADSPLGPFVEITDGTVTPAEWDSIDGTLYVDEAGQPWMVFVHEWVSTDDRIGRMCAAKMDADLTRFVSEPIELFRADDAPWARREVCITDGCYLYKTADGELLMLWSNFDKEDGYCVAIAHSDNGRIDGHWSQEPEPIFSRKLAGEYDGGHGMIFTALDGQKYLSIHSPNCLTPTRPETPVFVAIREKNGSLTCEADD